MNLAWRLASVALAFFAIAMVPKRALAVSIIYSNDVLGELEPCGCRSNPLGGFSRKANFISQLKTKEPSLIQLDAGDLFFETDRLPDALEKQAAIQAEYMVKTLNEIGHTAVVPGEKDFALGVKTLKKLRSSAKFDFLAANLQERKTGKPLFKASSIYERKSSDGKVVRVAVIGLVGEELRWPKELKATPMLKAAREQVQRLRKKSDFIVALTHQGFEKDQELANHVKDIDLIIGAHTQSFLQQPIKTSATYLFQSSFRNQYVGIIPLEKPFQALNHQLVPMGAELNSPVDQSTTVDKLVSELKTKIADLNLTVPTVEASALPSAKFQTFPQCAECHLKQFEFWRKTAHARAYEALFKKRDHLNKDCLSCHSLALGDPAGFREVTQVGEGFTLEELNDYISALAQAKSLDSQVKVTASRSASIRESLPLVRKIWVPVQCENCHQPGSGHPFSSVAPYKKEVARETCLKCHTSERAPEWYVKPGQPDWEKIQKKRAQITCPAGELSESSSN